ncbi:MAG: tRNA 2-thiouridine(34) synthase MnmA [Calditrichaeota bacterium]|nr:tRNA 2-thiouridine(34) synthase MnmA [Calditrichota bacterium]
MSGGVDSSVSAAILVEAGYQVTGFTLRLFDNPDTDDTSPNSNILDAKLVCEILRIPHHVIDLRHSFKDKIIDSFESEYLAGRTPNPCVNCNAWIKWGLLWAKASEMGMERLATGHYARLVRDEKKIIRLLKGLDLAKEQSYFLWQVPQHLLKVTILPLGEKTKQEVRDIARHFNLPVAEKSESLEICFIPDNDYRKWLSSRLQDIPNVDHIGEMVDNSGKVLGRHSGCHQFTIGQRKWLGLGGGSKLYVTAIDPQNNRVYVGEEDELLRSEFTVASTNIVDQRLFEKPDDLNVKIRYRDPGVPTSVIKVDEGVVLVKTRDPVKAVTPGQSAVFYGGDQVLGGGIIS